MPYKISGTLSDAARIIVIKESDWSIESNTSESSGSYEITGLVSGTKLIAARKSDGESMGYGSITPLDYSRGVFGGGYTASVVNIIEYITISTIGNTIDFGDLTTVSYYVGACSNGSNDRGCFGGGHTGSSTTNFINYITISSTGNGQDFGDLTAARFQLSATSNGTSDRGVFGGGNTGSIVNIMDYITISSTGDATDFGDLTVARFRLGSTSNETNNRGVFFSGYDVSGETNVIDYVTISSAGNATDFGDATIARSYLPGVSNGTNNRGCFGGGELDVGGAQDVIDYITISSAGNAVDFGDLTAARFTAGAVSNGTSNRGLFGGGNGPVNIIDYITISSIGNAADFGDLLITRMAVAGCSNA